MSEDFVRGLMWARVAVQTRQNAWQAVPIWHFLKPHVIYRKRGYVEACHDIIGIIDRHLDLISDQTPIEEKKR